MPQPTYPPQPPPKGNLPLTEREIAQQAARYTHAGMLSADQIISGEADRYQFLEPKVLEVIAWVQQALVAAERSDDLAKARTDPVLRREISEEIDRLALSYILKERGIRGEDGKVLIAMVINEIVGLGPLEPLWQDPEITEVICNGPHSVFVERSGRLVHARACRFRSQEHLLEVCQRILAPLNRKVDVRDPLADGRLPDGSRVNVVHHSIAPKGPLLTIRRFPEQNRSLKDLVDLGSMDEEMAALLATLVANKASTLVVGGTGSGKALDIDTPIPTPRGFVKMGDIAVGDEVFDEHGNPIRVVGAYDIEHNRECFEIHFSDGTTIVADAEHLWLTQAAHANQISPTPTLRAPAASYPAINTRDLRDLNALITTLPTDAVITTEDLSVALRWSPTQEEWLTSLMRASGVNGTSTSGGTQYLVSQVLSLLAEGSSTEMGTGAGAASRILTTAQIRDSLRDRLGRPQHAIPAVTGVVRYPVRDLSIPPRLLGLWVGSRGDIKPDLLEDFAASPGLVVPNAAGTVAIAPEIALHLAHITGTGSAAIPDEYLLSSEEQRRALLSGILDAGDVVRKASGDVVFTHSDEPLIRQVMTLCASLGYRPSVAPALVTANEKSHQSLYVVTLPGGLGTPTGLQSRVIVDVRPASTRPVRCIRVDSDSHLFLAGATYIPTHNTTLLNALSAAIPRHERVITIEDSLELRLHPESHVAAMEARPADATGSNAVSIRHLVKNALRMRPDRIVVGEIRDSAALDMLQACNTGHEGSMSTVHANGPDEAISRLTVMVAQGGEIPADKVEWLIGSALDLIVIARRFDDGSRRVAGVYEVPDVNNLAPGESLKTIPLWEWEQTGVSKNGRAEGRYVKRNDISPHLQKARGLDHGRTFTWDDVVALSADKPGGANASGPRTPVPPRPSVSRVRQEPA